MNFSSKDVDVSLADLLGLTPKEDSVGNSGIPSLSELLSSSKSDRNAEESLMSNNSPMKTDTHFGGFFDQNTTVPSLSSGLPSLSELSFHDNQKGISLSGLYNLSERKETTYETANLADVSFTKSSILDSNIPLLSMLANSSTRTANIDSLVTEDIKNLSLVDLANDHLMKVEGTHEHGNKVVKPLKKQQLSRRKGIGKGSNFLNVVGAKLKTPPFSPKGFCAGHNFSLPYLIYISHKGTIHKDMKDIFMFTTPSPDDIVKRYQQKAFQRDSLKD